MSLKAATFLALLGALLVAILEIWRLFSDVLDIAHGVAAPVIVFPALILALGSTTITVFFYVFHKSQN